MGVWRWLLPDKNGRLKKGYGRHYNLKWNHVAFGASSTKTARAWPKPVTLLAGDNPRSPPRLAWKAQGAYFSGKMHQNNHPNTP
jgi:hypothetical protein